MIVACDFAAVRIFVAVSAFGRIVDFIGRVFVGVTFVCAVNVTVIIAAIFANSTIVGSTCTVAFAVSAWNYSIAAMDVV